MTEPASSSAIVKPPPAVVRALGELASKELDDQDRDEMAIPSHTHWNPLIRWLMWLRYEAIAELMPNRVETALEFGCGLGLFLPTLANRATKVVGVDLFTGPAERAAREFDLEIKTCDSLSEIESGSVGLVVAADVLEHLEDLEATISEFQRILAAEGLLVVSGPTESLAYRVGRVLAGFSGKGDYHVTDIRRLRESIEAGCFVVTASKYLPHPWLPTLFEVHRFELR